MKNIKFVLLSTLGIILFFGCKKEDTTPSEPTNQLPIDEVDTGYYKSAQNFPGLVGSEEKRITDLRIDLDLNYNKVGGDLRIPQPPLLFILYKDKAIRILILGTLYSLWAMIKMIWTV